MAIEFTMSKMDIKTIAFATTYKVIHVLFTYAEFVLNLVVYLHNKYLDFFRAYTNTVDCDYISQHVKIVNKLPEHVSILLGTEEPSYNHLAKLIMWCMAAEIPFISLYDYKGVLRKQEDKLQAAVDKIQKIKEFDSHILWHSDDDSCKNGHLGKKTHIKILTIADGQHNVADTAKRLSDAKDKSIEQEVVETTLKNNFLFPDPDLALYCGKSFTVYGYPPWQIRITEFFCIRSQYSVTPEVFVTALYKFGKTEQRLGK